MSFFFKPLFLGLILAGMISASAEDKVKVGLFLGENNTPTQDALLAPEKLAHRLREVFGFKHYQMLKTDEIVLNNPWQQWFLPRKDFFIRIEPLPKKPGEDRLVDYEVYKDGFIIAKGKYEPNEQVPLFINGPDFKTGRLIFVLEAR